ncbi:ATP-binding cassette domain-containing protein [Vagococcus carniphilus]|uniref:ABC transporter ATP-binding protein n=1 Tax=Vagococcus carniphilus TaxID=218144 RepID=UPI00288F76BB|nr:ATP-binding cassette domain-containing protein [Vagococcus carniphilus]MDT2831565.1 ATP-binding cassette domain-containing protein [Vagococcus carniphilus]MDT2840527.1 ATP-binding cassette domain-containing protein [Vagococcus carniphilus]MDT2850050.1 ATP-binding cassette domain-containing protein [Vagococcus carniphilus]MDT2855185.1 ATP-binding cassette domain-containing protein [Vagococcus carniphilus]
MTRELVKVENIKRYFPVKNNFGQVKTVVKAIDNVSLTINEGETLGLVGESGSGKTTLGRSILQLETIDEGNIIFDGQSFSNVSKDEKRKMLQRMQIIFQDPYSSLNPRMTALEQVLEPLLLQFEKKEALLKAEAILKKVGFTEEMFQKYPKEFSGGQRQRIGIARAVVVNPSFILCDEPISALDVSIQAQVINLLIELQKELKLTYLFISHDLSMVRYISDRIAVMYLGRIVEMGPSETIFENPQHEYTKRLLQAIPIADPKLARKAQTEKEVNLIKEIDTSNQTEWVEVTAGHFVLKEKE